MNAKFGYIGKLTKKQTNRVHFRDIPIGEKFLVLNSVNLPAYDVLGLFVNHTPQTLNNGEEHYSGYLEKNSYEIIGSIFADAAKLLKS